MKKTVIRRLVIGFIAGAIVGNLIAIISSLISGHFAVVTTLLENELGLAGAIVLQSFLSGLIGLAGIGGMSLYDIDKLNLIAATTLHFVCIIISFTIAYFSLAWGNRSVVIYFIICAIELAIFTIIWFCMYFAWKKQIKELNDNLEKYKEGIDEKQ